MSQAFSLQNSVFGHEPKALPWAGMNQAVGLRIRPPIADLALSPALPCSSPVQKKRGRHRVAASLKLLVEWLTCGGARPTAQLQLQPKRT